jgi:hypothetical protein
MLFPLFPLFLLEKNKEMLWPLLFPRFETKRKTNATTNLP